MIPPIYPHLNGANTSMASTQQHYQQRFSGVARLYGNQALSQLQASHVLIIGIGGVGSWIAEALARTGIGQLSLMDLDDICVSNSNRQIHTLSSTIGQSKIQTMAQRLKDINPDLTVNIIEDFLERDNINTYINKKYSVVVDAIDAVMTKAALISHCKRNKIPIITTGSAGGKKNPQNITISDLSKSINDPLLSKVRNNLRRLHGFSRSTKNPFKVKAIYSTEQMTYPDNNGETCQSKQFLSDSNGLDCSQGFGASTMVSATFGFMAATEAVKKIIQ